MMLAGLPPYRVSPPFLPYLAQGSETYWDVVAGMKRLLDPDDILSPGRYRPTAQQPCTIGKEKRVSRPAHPRDAVCAPPLARHMPPGRRPGGAPYPFTHPHTAPPTTKPEPHPPQP